MMIRTFIALEIPLEAIDELIKFRDNNVLNKEKYKWEPKEKLHLTLKFLGDTEEETVEKISEHLKQLISSYSTFDLSFSEFGLFRKDDKPRIFWVGLKENTDLVKFALEVDNICSKFGYEREKRKFKSHITLLRIKSLNGIQSILDLTNIQIPEIFFYADKVTFFKSKLISTGSVYIPLKEFLLNK